MIRQALAASLRMIASCALVATWLVAPVLAQDPPPANPDKSSWVLGYALVILGIALGLVAVCRPGNRTSEVRIEDD